MQPFTTCPTCFGDGIVEYEDGSCYDPSFGNDLPAQFVTETCPTCNGTGQSLLGNITPMSKEPILPELETREDAIHLCEQLYRLDLQMLSAFLEEYNTQQTLALLAAPLPETWIERIPITLLASVIAAVGYDALSDYGLREYALFQDEYERNYIEYLEEQMKLREEGGYE